MQYDTLNKKAIHRRNSENNRNNKY